MSRITVDSQFLSQIPIVGSSVEVCDHRGDVVGWLVLNPIPSKRDYEEASAQHDPAFIEKSRRQKGIYTVDEALKRVAGQ
jgi:hypothetical protein